MKTIFDDMEQLEHDAASFGFRWETKEQIMRQIRSECVEIEELFHSTARRKDLQDEIGDLLHATFSLCIFCGFAPETTLRQSLDKFEHRFEAVTALAKEQGLSNLNGKSFDELMHYWTQAKIKTSPSVKVQEAPE